MKTLRLIPVLLVLSLSTARAADQATPAGAPATNGATAAAFDPADAPPELRGMLVIGEERRFTLTTPGGTQSGWAAVGEEFNGWKLVEFRETDQVLVVRKEDVTVEVPLATSTIVARDVDKKATLAQAEALMKRMNFESMFTRMIDQQKKMAVSMTRQMMAKNPEPGVSADDLAAFQAKVMDVMWAEMNPEQMQREMAQAYAEVFTPTELQGMAEFYATPAGTAMLDKSPELQQRMMQSMMPRMMNAMPKIKQMGEEFKAAQKLKAEQAAGNPSPAPANPAPNP